jgi:hypothetical protein
VARLSSGRLVGSLLFRDGREDVRNPVDLPGEAVEPPEGATGDDQQQSQNDHGPDQQTPAQPMWSIGGRRLARLGSRLFAVTSACARLVLVRPDGETTGRVSVIVADRGRCAGSPARRRSIISGGSRSPGQVGHRRNGRRSRRRPRATRPDCDQAGAGQVSHVVRAASSDRIIDFRRGRLAGHAQGTRSPADAPAAAGARGRANPGACDA